MGRIPPKLTKSKFHAGNVYHAADPVLVSFIIIFEVNKNDVTVMVSGM